MLKILLTLSLLCGVAICSPKKPVSGAVPPAAQGAPTEVGSSLDTALVRKYYQEGDFERAIPILESLLKSKKTLNHGDSVFVFKHLGVMYAASETTRERGKYYMLQLLHIEPTARIMDMYASDMIYMIFRNIQEEYSMARAKMNRAESHLASNQNPVDAKAPQPAPEKEDRAAVRSSNKTYYLIGAVTLMAGVGVAAYVLTQDQPVTTKSQQVD